MNKICITSFDPFDGRTINTSREVINKLTNHNLVKKDLKVSYNIKDDIEKILKENYDVLILTGEAQGRENLTIEKLAINLKSASRPDNDGVVYFNERIDNGPDAYFSNVDVIELNRKLNSLGYNTKVSLSAGSYICNLSYYYALKYVKEHNLKTKVIFIHFPINYDMINKYKMTIEKIIEII